MKIDISNLNPKGKFKHLIADDLFASGVQQVFDARTGKYIGVLQDGKEILFNEQDEPEIKPEPEIINPKQIKLF